ncbi:GemA protein [Lysobacteraceae bacterium NML75-0749]|nr:GemA protein [Xanthomonadaceae bacterium NML75-0749]
MSRASKIAMIHIAKKQLGLSDADYRMLLMQASSDKGGCGGVWSCANMSDDQLTRVMLAMKREGFDPARGYATTGKRKRGGKAAAGKAANPAVFANRPKNTDEVPMLRKIAALLADAKRPWNYAHHTARQMFGIERLEWLDSSQLHKLIGALQIDADRRAKRKNTSHKTTRKPRSKGA